MIKINPDPTFTADVDITIPGQEKPGKITLTFKYMSRQKMSDFWDKNKDREVSEIFMDIAEGWGGVDAEFTTENIKTFLDNYPMATPEILDAYRRLLMESRVKN